MTSTAGGGGSSGSVASKIGAFLTLRESQEVSLKEAEAKIKALEGQLKAAGSAAEKKNKELSKLREERKQNEAAIEKIREEHAQHLEAEKEKAAVEKEELSNKLKVALEESEGNLRARHDAEEKKRNAVRLAKKEKDSREKAEAALEEERKRNDKQDRLHTSVAKLKVKGEQQVREAKNQADQVRDELNSALQIKEELEDKLVRLETSLKASETSYSELCGKLQEERHVSEEKLRQLKKEYDEVRAGLAQEQTSSTLLKRTIDHMDKSKAKAEQEKSAIDEELRITRAKLEDTVASLNSLEKEIELEKSKAKTTPVPVGREEEKSNKGIDAREEAAAETLEKIKAALEARNISLDFLLNRETKHSQVAGGAASSSNPEVKLPKLKGAQLSCKVETSQAKAESSRRLNAAQPKTENGRHKAASAPAAISPEKPAQSDKETRRPKRPSKKPAPSQVDAVPLNGEEQARDTTEAESKERDVEEKSIYSDMATGKQQVSPSRPLQGAHVYQPLAQPQAESQAQLAAKQKSHSRLSRLLAPSEVPSSKESRVQAAEESMEHVTSEEKSSSEKRSSEQSSSEQSSSEQSSSEQNGSEQIGSEADPPSQESCETQLICCAEDEEGKQESLSSERGAAGSSKSKRKSSKKAKAKPAASTSPAHEIAMPNPQQLRLQEARREERAQLQQQYKHQKELEKQQQQAKVRKARSRSIERTQKEVLKSLDPDVEKPSKLEIGMNLFDIAPQTTDDDGEEDAAVEGDIESLLYPRPDRGWRKREEDHKPEQSVADTSKKFATGKLLESKLADPRIPVAAASRRSSLAK